jgi:hypothetical protein
VALGATVPSEREIFRLEEVEVGELEIRLALVEREVTAPVVAAEEAVAQQLPAMAVREAWEVPASAGSPRSSKCCRYCEPNPPECWPLCGLWWYSRRSLLAAK